MINVGGVIDMVLATDMKQVGYVWDFCHDGAV